MNKSPNKKQIPLQIISTKVPTYLSTENTNIKLLEKSRQLQIQKEARTKTAKSLRNARGRRGPMGRSGK